MSSSGHTRVLLCFCQNSSLVNSKGVLADSLPAPSPVPLSMSEAEELLSWDDPTLCEGWFVLFSCLPALMFSRLQVFPELSDLDLAVWLLAFGCLMPNLYADVDYQMESLIQLGQHQHPHQTGATQSPCVQ